MKSESLSRDGLENNFNKMLQEAVDLGVGFYSAECGLDGPTQNAIVQVAQAFPNIDPALIRNARKEFAKQLDGTHQREEDALWDELAISRYGE